MFKIQLQKDQNLFFTSDTHFGHKNIVRGVTEWDKERAKRSTRDFDTIDEMNEVIVNSINNTVKENDILVHLGDWSFGGFDNIKIFRDRIVCKNVYLILGNHDQHILNNKTFFKSNEWGTEECNIREIFTKVMYGQVNLEVTRFERLLTTGDMSPVKYHFVLSHYPIASWEDMSKGWMHLFGHVHLRPNHALREGKAMDVGMDGNNFKPHSFQDILSIMRKQPIASLSLPRDHHSEDVK